MNPTSTRSTMYTVRAVAAFSRFLLRHRTSNVQVRGLEKFLSVLEDRRRIESGTGLVTYCNHISVLDEPTLWGALPPSVFRTSDTVRWTLGASDIMFTNPFLSRFFTNGQCIETHRGQGIYQPAIDTAINKLDQGKWIHLFPEGYVNVSANDQLRRFKWGIARMLLETQKVPIVIPIWISGFDRFMPEPRAWPRWWPRFSPNVSITFGDPIQQSLSPLLETIKNNNPSTLESQDLLPSHLRRHATPATSSSSSSASSEATHPSNPLPTWNLETIQPAKLPSNPSIQVSEKSLLSFQQENLELAKARSSLSDVLRYHLELVAQEYRRSKGNKTPALPDPLYHGESLRPKSQQQEKTIDDGKAKKVGV